MKWKIYISLLVAVFAAAVVMAWLHVQWGYVAGAMALGVILACMLCLAIHKPLNAVANGIYLLREQDFSSRLRLTGQSDADKVVRLFNSLMDSMKKERLKQKEQSHLLALLIEASPSGIAICDFDGRIIEKNAAFERLVNAEVERQLAGMGDNEVRMVRADSSQIFRCSRLWFMDSGFRRPFFLVELMTEEIARAEKQLFTRIIRTIGHEVNNTMGSVASVLDTMKLIHEGEPDTEAALQSAIDSCMNLAGFVRGYSSLVKLPEPVPEPLELNDFADSIAPSLRALVPEKNVLEIRHSASPSVVMADPMLMHRVISNIVKNSAESIGDRPGGNIIIAVGERSLEITDNGRGISPEAAVQLFTPFFSTKRPDRGLGLMLVADILRAHKASFTLSTDADTALTTFRITFPR